MHNTPPYLRPKLDSSLNEKNYRQSAHESKRIAKRKLSQTLHREAKRRTILGLRRTFGKYLIPQTGINLKFALEKVGEGPGYIYEPSSQEKQLVLSSLAKQQSIDKMNTPPPPGDEEPTLREVLDAVTDLGNRLTTVEQILGVNQPPSPAAGPASLIEGESPKEEQ